MTIPMNCSADRAEASRPMRIAFTLASLAALAACTTAPEPITATPARDAEKEPVLVVAALTARPDGLRYNEHGGIIPDPSPVTPVAEGAIGEVPTD